MPDFKDLIQSADWKAEKHVPVIETAEQIKSNEPCLIQVSVGKQIAHPNTTEHHIRSIDLYFLPRDEKFPYQLARFEFCAHGESALGPNASTVFCQPQGKCVFQTAKSGAIIAIAYCNIHGIWKNEKQIEVI
ncbi:MAG: class II SORL domain-containing protein [Candidatus Omnitrophica bacterium]|jgi:superoxide reductase|nr:class II SORL domain-containing protein [Candidatus Omnitrophota bacterium]